MANYADTHGQDRYIVSLNVTLNATLLTPHTGLQATAVLSTAGHYNHATPHDDAHQQQRWVLADGCTASTQAAEITIGINSTYRSLPHQHGHSAACHSTVPEERVSLCADESVPGAALISSLMSSTCHWHNQGGPAPNPRSNRRLAGEQGQCTSSRCNTTHMQHAVAGQSNAESWHGFSGLGAMIPPSFVTDGSCERSEMTAGHPDMSEDQQYELSSDSSMATSDSGECAEALQASAAPCHHNGVPVHHSWVNRHHSLLPITPVPGEHALLASLPLNNLGLIRNSVYRPLSMLGQGSFGFVLKCQDCSSGEIVAVKMIHRQRVVSKYLEAEVRNHSQLAHPHIIEFKRVLLTEEYVCIAMEYADGGCLFQYVKQRGRLSEGVARWFFQQIILGVDYCHRSGIANRDIKLENMLLIDADILPLPLLKLSDFGYSKSELEGPAKSRVGTMTYMAPEVLLSRDNEYDGRKADVWACGVLLYIMLFGHYPFGGGEVFRSNSTILVNIMYMIDKMLDLQFTLPPAVPVSEECCQLLMQLLNPREDRMSMEQVMASPWFLKDLPQDAAQMNDKYLAMDFSEYTQPAEEIEWVLAHCRRTNSTVHQ